MNKARTKNAAAVELARLKWAKATPAERERVSEELPATGGQARAAKLSKRRRAEIARKAAAARWGKKRPTKES